jgi:FkbM family methyltransferase
LFYKYFGRCWAITFENGLKSRVYPYPDNDAGEVNIWTRNVDWYDIELIRMVISEGDFCVDAGCNIGNRTLAIADMLGGALLIDAGKKASERTLENIRLNNLPTDKFVVINKAVGRSQGMVEFTDLGGASTLNHVVKESTDSKTVKIELTTIDVELKKMGKKPTFIKVDVEGLDLDVLQGSIDTLKNGSVQLVKFERNSSEPLNPLIQFFENISWLVFALNKKGRATRDFEIVSKNMNLFACPANVFDKINVLSQKYKKN